MMRALHDQYPNPGPHHCVSSALPLSWLACRAHHWDGILLASVIEKATLLVQGLEQEQEPFALKPPSYWPSGVKWYLSGSRTGPWTWGTWFDSHFRRKLCHLQHFRQSPISALNKGGSPIELPSLWGTWVRAESLLLTYPGQCWDSVVQFLQTPDTGQSTTEWRPIR